MPNRLVLQILLASSLAGRLVAQADIPVLRHRADSLLERRRFDAARLTLLRLVSLQPDDGRHWLRLGDAEAGLDHPAEAIAAYRAALELGFGARAERCYTISRLYARLGSRDSTMAWLARALEARYEHRPSIGGDSAFAAYQHDPEFRRLAGVLPDTPLTRDEGWRFDVAFLADEARRMATGPTPVARTAPFDSAVSAVAARVDQVSDARMYVELQRLMTMLGNGHSILFPFPTRLVTLTMLPIDLYRFSDGIFVVGAQDSAGTPLIGSKVERIGDLSPEQALERSAPLITRDNPMGLTWNGPYFLTYPFLVHSLGIDQGADSNTVRLRVRSPDGRIAVVTLRGGDIREPPKLMPPPGTSTRPPLYLRHPDQPQWLQPLPDAAALYVQYNQVVDGERVSIAAFADSILASVRRTGARNLIVDVRRNNGGHGSLNPPMVRALVRFETMGPGHQIFLIVGRNTFSAAGNFITAVERMTSALFVGEPSSSRPNSVGEDTELLLPWSGFTGSMASRYFQDSDPLDDRVWIPMDMPVALSSADYFGNRDPVLDAVLNNIRARRGRH